MKANECYDPLCKLHTYKALSGGDADAITATVSSPTQLREIAEKCENAVAALTHKRYSVSIHIAKGSIVLRLHSRSH